MRYNPKYAAYFQMLMVKKELESIRHRLLSDLRNEMAVRMGVVDPLLSALGWDTRDYKKVYPEFSTPNGRVDYALCSESSEPLCFIEAKPLGKIDGTKEQLFGYTEYSEVSIAVLTDGQEWHFFYAPGEGTWEDKQVHTLDLIDGKVQENAKFFQSYLSYQAVRSGGAENAMRSDYANSVIEKKMKAHCPDEAALKHLLDDGPEDISLATYFENAIGQRPTDQQVYRFFKSVTQSSPEEIQSQKRGPNERLYVKMHDGTVIDFPKQNAVLFEVMKRLVDEFGGDTIIAADKKRPSSPRLIWHEDETDVPGGRIWKPYSEYRIVRDHKVDRKKQFLNELARELGIVLCIKTS